MTTILMILAASTAFGQETAETAPAEGTVVAYEAPIDTRPSVGQEELPNTELGSNGTNDDQLTSGTDLIGKPAASVKIGGVMVKVENISARRLGEYIELETERDVKLTYAEAARLRSQAVLKDAENRAALIAKNPENAHYDGDELSLGQLPSRAAALTDDDIEPVNPWDNTWGGGGNWNQFGGLGYGGGGLGQLMAIDAGLGSPPAANAPTVNVTLVVPGADGATRTSGSGPTLAERRDYLKTIAAKHADE